jgi:hypothetical protein
VKSEKNMHVDGKGGGGVTSNYWHVFYKTNTFGTAVQVKFTVDMKISLGYESYAPCILAGWRKEVEKARQGKTEERNKDVETQG